MAFLSSVQRPHITGRMGRNFGLIGQGQGYPGTTLPGLSPSANPTNALRTVGKPTGRISRVEGGGGDKIGAITQSPGGYDHNAPSTGNALTSFSEMLAGTTGLGTAKTVLGLAGLGPLSLHSAYQQNEKTRKMKDALQNLGYTSNSPEIQTLVGDRKKGVSGWDGFRGKWNPTRYDDPALRQEFGPYGVRTPNMTPDDQELARITQNPESVTNPPSTEPSLWERTKTLVGSYFNPPEAPIVQPGVTPIDVDPTAGYATVDGGRGDMVSQDVVGNVDSDRVAVGRAAAKANRARQRDRDARNRGLRDAGVSGHSTGVGGEGQSAGYK